MKRLGASLLVLACMVSFVFMGQLVSFAKSETVRSYEDFKRMERKNPPEHGLYWAFFGVLGDYVPMQYPTSTFLYGNGSQVYRLKVEDPLETYYAYRDSGVQSAAMKSYVEHWDRYKDDIESYSVYQYHLVELMQYDGDVKWYSPKVAVGDLTHLRKTEGAITMMSTLDGKLVYEYSASGLTEITWMYDGLLYRLSVDRNDGDSQTHDPFGEEDIELVRRLTNTDYCGGAINDLMGSLLGNAVSEMNEGVEMPKPSKPSLPSDEVEEPDNETDDGSDDQGKEPQKAMSTTWIIIWSVVGVITLAGIVVIVIDIIRTKRR